ncbi:MAG: transcriptional repressor [Rhizobiaceae bacterium]|nr:transcriptional repressor [Rhizobiaceae bacterium]
MEARGALLAALKAKGLRLTRQRLAIVEQIVSASDHPDAVELFRRVRHSAPGTSLSTVYRTLTALEEHGLVQRQSFGGASARFEKADSDHHDHIVDLDTGDVIEFMSPLIEELQTRIAAEHGYMLVSHRMELFCRKLPKARRTRARVQSTPSTASNPSKRGGPA